jgi:ketosteroid isomerase-like protein
MNPTRRLLGVAMMAAALVACSRPEPVSSFDANAVRKTIEEKNAQFTRAHVTGDVATINAYFTADAKIFQPHTDVVTGVAEVAALNLEYTQFGITEFREETTALYGNEANLIEEGRYFMVYGADSTIENGKYINVWRKVGDDWKVHANIWNSSLPAPP